MATYKLRFFFDNIAGVCLWAGDTTTMERFDYPVALDMLPISSDLTDAGGSLIARWERHIYDEQPWPPGDSLPVFARDCLAFVGQLQSALPDGYEIADEHTAKLMRVHTSTPQTLCNCTWPPAMAWPKLCACCAQVTCQNRLFPEQSAGRCAAPRPSSDWPP